MKNELKNGLIAEFKSDESSMELIPEVLKKEKNLTEKKSPGYGRG